MRGMSHRNSYTRRASVQELLAIVYKRLAEEWRVVHSHEECVTYGRSIRYWPAFPDSADALEYLAQHYRLIILSNIDNESFTYSNSKLRVRFDAVITAEDIGSYKPSPRNFQYMFDKLAGCGVHKEKVLPKAESLFHDHKRANEAGSCWVYRRHAQQGLVRRLIPVCSRESISASTAWRIWWQRIVRRFREDEWRSLYASNRLINSCVAFTSYLRSRLARWMSTF